VLSALATVDAVMVFGESTPLEIILVVRPDVMAKGGDYSPDTINRAAEVESWVGQVRVVPIVKGLSTTGPIEKDARKQRA
jgi:bifunctional ADP-heptose synthase (sugar kinase/adenylyltransferase)